MCMCLSELVLTIRTWAIWERNRKLGMSLLLFFSAIWTSIIVLLKDHIARVTSAPKMNFKGGCSVKVSSDNNIIVIWSLMMGFQFVTLILVSIKGYQSFQHSRSSAFFQVVYINGILYYVYLFALSSVNVIFPLISKREFTDFPRQVVQSILTCRMLFDLRQYGNRVSVGDGSAEFTSCNSVGLDTIVFQPGATTGIALLDTTSRAGIPRNEE